jgi:hypothetical protein
MTPSDSALLRPLFDGPLNIIGDVHGEFEALQTLLRRLGYEPDGSHPEGRRAVFLGDLTDRGPDSPGVVGLVARWLKAGRAQCIMGNHELNILQGEHKHGNAWFFGQPEALDRSGRVVPQVLADDRVRAEALELFRRLPIALVREDLRVVHACWDQAMVEAVRGETDAIRYGLSCLEQIDSDLRHRSITDPTERSLARQNRNPIKVLTSGLEHRLATPFYAAGKMRTEGRLRWWDRYTDAVPCVFGHYWRRRLPDDTDDNHLFDDSRPYAPLGNGYALCIDYSVGKRWRERPPFGTGEPFHTILAALRWPEKWLYFDVGHPVPLG